MSFIIMHSIDVKTYANTPDTGVECEYADERKHGATMY